MGLLRYNTHTHDSQQNHGPDSLVQRMGGLGLTDEEMLDTESSNMVDRGIWRLWRQGQPFADILVQCHERNLMVDDNWLEECLGRGGFDTSYRQTQYAAREPSTQEEPHVPFPAPWSDPSSNEENDNDDSDETIVPHNHNLSEDQDPSGSSSGSGISPARISVEVKVWNYRRRRYTIQETHDALTDEGYTVELHWISEVLGRRISGPMLETRLWLEAVYPEGRELKTLRAEMFERFRAGCSVEELDGFLIARGYYVELEWLLAACYVDVGDDEE